jgi:hypothetical protein
MRWPRFLTHGNWGGPGWSGGEYVADRRLTRWEVEPVDAMDAAFREHDFAYQNGPSRAQADLALARTLAGTDVRGLWPNLYRLGAMLSFGIKGAIGRLLLLSLLLGIVSGCDAPKADIFSSAAPDHYQMIPAAVEMSVPDMEARDPITPDTGTLPAEMRL